MDLIDKNLLEEEKRREPYWICKDTNYRGIIPKLLIQYREERFRQQGLENNSMQTSIKKSD